MTSQERVHHEPPCRSPTELSLPTYEQVVRGGRFYDPYKLAGSPEAGGSSAGGEGIPAQPLGELPGRRPARLAASSTWSDKPKILLIVLAGVGVLFVGPFLTVQIVNHLNRCEPEREHRFRYLDVQHESLKKNLIQCYNSRNKFEREHMNLQKALDKAIEENKRLQKLINTTDNCIQVESSKPIQTFVLSEGF